ncbi:MAG: Rrf2 family transcriptional regulator [Acidobacteriia bacterium]|nr:Rrf2 family transcriptional regulator [Terriglobia bacterium]
MIYSRSAEYAIRAFVYLAHAPEGKFILARQIAKDTGIPAHFLAKILQQLAKKGHLLSSKGPTGGFRLRTSPGDTSMFEIVNAMDGMLEFQRCISGNLECSDDAPCGLHDSWKPIRSQIMEYLEETTISDVAESLAQKRRAIGKQKKGRRTPAKGD